MKPTNTIAGMVRALLGADVSFDIKSDGRIRTVACEGNRCPLEAWTDSSYIVLANEKAAARGMSLRRIGNIMGAADMPVSAWPWRNRARRMLLKLVKP